MTPKGRPKGEYGSAQHEGTPGATPDPAHGAIRVHGGKFALLAVFVAVVVAFFALDGQRYLSLEAVKANRDTLLAFTNEHFLLALAIAFLCYAGAVAFSLPGALVMSLTVGFIFGRWVGTVLVVLAATLGATLVFLAARYLFADAARRRMGALGEKLSAGFAENAFHYLLFLRLVPLFPFFLVNLAPAFTRISLRTYVAGTFIGIIPATFVFVNLGQTLGRIDSLSGLVSTEAIGAFVLLGLLALVPVAVKKFRSGREAKA
jgi:uncharacterized membrane protein YdjX (TVP38/TMEM64 family)